MSTNSMLYLIEILHQTTTEPSRTDMIRCCILSKFYIKPQLRDSLRYSDFRCILSKFYIKPQPLDSAVSRRESCILSKFYIKPQQLFALIKIRRCCILSKFYIKPQHQPQTSDIPRVVSYRNSTSNHNKASDALFCVFVVSYRNSTSNHNKARRTINILEVVSYRNSTSNHNNAVPLYSYWVLYLIEILHQTTTMFSTIRFVLRCILSKFYIKPQHELLQ